MSSMSSASSDAPLDVEKGCSGAKASSDAPVDLEEGATDAKSPSKCILVSWDVFTVLLVFCYIAIITLVVKRYGRASWLAVLIILANLVGATWMAPKMKYDRKSARGKDDDSSLNTGLIASKE